MTQKPLLFIDVETTGTNPNRDRIIELGLLRVEHDTIVGTYKTLVDPEMPIPSDIFGITGITDNDVKNAPHFRQAIRECAELFEDAIFIAHNANFDYSFIKSEMARAGLPFSMPRLCTVRLSRRLFPHLPHHNLDALIERHNLVCESRHRAYDDAHVLWQFWQKIHTELPTELLEKHISHVLAKMNTPTPLSESELEKYPASPGVYIFYNSTGAPLYVGKSVNLASRIKSHFVGSSSLLTDLRLRELTSKIKIIPTPGELSALLLESKLVKQLQPLYNRRLRLSRRLLLAKKAKNPHGFFAVTLENVPTIESFTDDIIGVFTSRRAYTKAAESLARDHHLCHYLLGLEKHSPCFGSQLDICRGACTNTESPELYNLRFDMAFAQSSISPWPFSGPVQIYEDVSSSESVIADSWVIRGEEPSVDNYKILKSFFLHPPLGAKIIPYSAQTSDLVFDTNL